MFDNVSIYKINEVNLLIKKFGWVVFSIPPYLHELNQIERTFGILKSNMVKNNFNASIKEGDKVLA